MPEDDWRQEQLQAFYDEYEIVKFRDAPNKRQEWLIMELKYWIKKFQRVVHTGEEVLALNHLLDFTKVDAFQHKIPLESITILLPFLSEQLKLAEAWQLPQVRSQTILPLGSTTIGEIKLQLAEEIPADVWGKMSNEEFYELINKVTREISELVKKAGSTDYMMDTATIAAQWSQQLRQNEENLQKLRQASEQALRAIENAPIDLVHSEKVRLQKRSVEIQLQIGEFEQWFTGNYLPIPKPITPSVVKVSLLERCKTECEKRELPQGNTLSKEMKYELATAIDLDDLGTIEEFQSGTPAYHRISKMLSELGYSRKRSSRYTQ